MKLDAAGAALEADLAMPPEPRGVVLFAHGSGSSRMSPRNRLVASHLGAAGFGTLLTDLLTPDEEQTDAVTGELRFDVRLLARRLTAIVDHLPELPQVRQLPIGLFGASTGAAAALLAAAARPRNVRAVVSRGGRPDLAGDHLPGVIAPTLLIVGERDPEVIELNRAAATRLGGEWALRIVAGATHLFEEPHALDEVARAAGAWFGVHLSARGRGTEGPSGVVMEGGGHA
ncbi:dienelactone hydrolase family protein [Phytohabitans sp. ZYX-F-186]|uniref:Dienelactone hydrolase family protein n=1 Tax=Phytohabitans maris TaxID=3071409 RepID=A0ABU0ZJX2_9ACTN|nr:dienelactone hydrolase family protein [Phytohabitans sp. ZYX-F-186]MDQ7906247.1 dienelactone hydrolase family protein [Phytohabitans sp. ZYX-F-186]